TTGTGEAAVATASSLRRPAVTRAPDVSVTQSRALPATCVRGFWQASTMTAQPGIFAFGTSEHCYLELRLTADADPARLLAAVAGHTESLSTTGGVNVFVGVRPELWPGLAGSRPQDSIGMNEDVVGLDGFRMPATQRDVWIWVSGGSRTSVFDATAALTTALAEVATVESELDGWVYQQDRDLTGF